MLLSKEHVACLLMFRIALGESRKPRLTVQVPLRGLHGMQSSFKPEFPNHPDTNGHRQN
jgi:hypothetical protein